MNITIIGTGYVGLVTGACFSKMGNRVYCYDVDADKIHDLNDGILPIFEPQLEGIIKSSKSRGDLVFTDNIKDALDGTDVIFITVGTPMNDDGSADITSVLNAAREIASNISHDALVVVKSTVPVGTCDKVKKIINETSSFNIEVASNPEFLKEGRAIEDCMHPDRVVIGADKAEVFDTLKDLYSSFVLNHDRFILMDIKSSEMTKYVANSMLATKISFMNEIAGICEATGADVRKVRLGIGSDKRIGYDFIYAGCGYGGSCFPKDIQALIKTSQDFGYSPKILPEVEHVNDRQKRILADKITDCFGDDLNERQFAVWGLSFKPGTNDVREAPSLEIITSLIDRGAKIRAYDPQATDEFKDAIDDEYLKSIEFCQDRYSAVMDCDALILITEWKEFRNPDFDLLSDKLRQNIIFDGRNIYDKKTAKGFRLYQIGC